MLLYFLFYRYGLGREEVLSFGALVDAIQDVSVVREYNNSTIKLVIVY